MDQDASSLEFNPKPYINPKLRTRNPQLPLVPYRIRKGTLNSESQDACRPLSESEACRTPKPLFNYLDA